MIIDSRMGMKNMDESGNIAFGLPPLVTPFFMSCVVYINRNVILVGNSLPPHLVVFESIIDDAL